MKRSEIIQAIISKQRLNLSDLEALDVLELREVWDLLLFNDFYLNIDVKTFPVKHRVFYISLLRCVSDSSGLVRSLTELLGNWLSTLGGEHDVCIDLLSDSSRYPVWCQALKCYYVYLRDNSQIDANSIESIVFKSVRDKLVFVNHLYIFGIQELADELLENVFKTDHLEVEVFMPNACRDFRNEVQSLKEDFQTRISSTSDRPALSL